MALAFLVYFSALALLFFFLFPILVNKNDIIVKKYYVAINYIFPIMMVTLLFGLRYGVGDDFFSYKSLYENFEMESSRLEYLYSLLATLLRNLNFPYYMMNTVIILLTFVFIYLFLNKVNFIDRRIVLFFYFVCGFLIKALNIQRHAVAIAIFLYALTYLYKRNFLAYSFFLIIAAGFHISILSLLPFYVVFPFFLKKKTYLIQNRILLVIITILIMLFHKNIFSYFMDNILQIVSLTPYGLHGIWIFMDIAGTGSGVGIILTFVSGIICILYSDKLYIAYNKYFGMLFFMFLFGLWGEILSDHYIYFLRFIEPFSTLRIIIYSMLVIYLLKSKKMMNLIVAISFIFIYIGYFAGQILLRGSYNFVFGT